MARKILIIEDDEHIVELIKFNLEQNNFEVVVAKNGDIGLEEAKSIQPDLILLDLMLPEIDGIEICKILKASERYSDIPIIMLTAKSSETDKIVGLELGADDYLTKPFSVRELLARIKVILKRYGKNKESASKNTENVLTIDELKMDMERHEVYIGDKMIQLTYKEFELLKLLALNRGKVLKRDYLLDEIWGYEYYGETRTVDVHIRHLRKKIEDEHRSYIETVRGVGYKIK
ncbi:MAG: response regulator transcription factor [Firmicutes bacterium]|jgi:two-component system alkaline phosphatase synthesis response regulator PhoP|nr:response regulator transcription factor [Bacillota bacterium]